MHEEQEKRLKEFSEELDNLVDNLSASDFESKAMVNLMMSKCYEMMSSSYLMKNENFPAIAVLGDLVYRLGHCHDLYCEELKELNAESTNTPTS